VPALVRLLTNNALAELKINNGGQLLDEPAAALLSDALLANTSLTSLSLEYSNFGRNAAAAVVLLTALTGHPRLRNIDLSGNRVPRVLRWAAAACAALGALVAANAPSLQQLDVSYNALGDAGLGPLVEALRHNTHLRVLNCAHNGMSEAFAHDRLLPAVHANASLRTLTVEPLKYGKRAPDSAREASALVAARAQQ
jgi:Ran GTPase-activating protein (RanGAP) involved in mRNA processing and transport